MSARQSSSLAERLRQDFPLLSDYRGCYLDSAATTQKPAAVLAAMERYYRTQNANVHRGAHELSDQATQAFEQARTQVQRFIHAARPEEIVWTRGTTEAINLVANSFGATLQPGDRVLISQLEHHANIVPWQLLRERSGIEIDVIPITDTGDLDLDAYQQLLGPRTRLVAVSHVSNALGTLNPVAEICHRAHAAGARVLIDGAQAVAHLPVDVQAIDCDFYVFSGHKVYGPTGIGVLYGKYELLEQLPPWQGGGEMIAHVSFSGSRYQPPPLRFEAGTPAIAEAIGLAAALSYLAAQDRAALLHEERQLLQRAVTTIDALPGLRVIGHPNERCGVVSFIAEGEHSLDLGSFLDQRSIALRSGHHCCMPLMEHLGLPGTARLSAGCYTTSADLELLLDALRDYTNADNAGGRQTGEHRDSLATRLRNARGRDQRHALLMKAGSQPLSRDPALHQDAHRLDGCNSQVWLRHRWNADRSRLHFDVDSDARIIRAVIRLLLEALQDRPPAEIEAFDAASYLEELGLARLLSSSRTSGALAIVNAMQRIARIQE